MKQRVRQQNGLPSRRTRGNFSQRLLPSQVLFKQPFGRFMWENIWPRLCGRPVARLALYHAARLSLPESAFGPVSVTCLLRAKAPQYVEKWIEFMLFSVCRHSLVNAASESWRHHSGYLLEHSRKRKGNSCACCLGKAWCAFQKPFVSPL